MTALRPAEVQRPAVQEESGEIRCSSCPIDGACAPPYPEDGNLPDFMTPDEELEAGMEPDNCPHFGGFEPSDEDVDIGEVFCRLPEGVTS